MNRRNLLRSLGAGSASMGIMSTVAADSSTQSQSIDELSVNEYDGYDRSKLLIQAIQDDDFQQILQYAHSEGWKPDWSEAHTRNIVNEKKGSYDLIVVEFYKDNLLDRGKEDDTDEQLVAWWFGNETFDLKLDEHTSMVQVPPASEVEEQSDPEVQSESSDRIDVINPGAQSANKETHHLASTSDVQPSSHSHSYDCSDTCIIDLCIHGVRDFNWKCVLLILGSGFTTAVSCLGCATSGPLMLITCPACAISALFLFNTLAKCTTNWGGCIDTMSREVPTEWLDENNIDCDDVHATNGDRFAIHEDELSDIPTC